jgi:hypothetical protein
MIRPFGRRARRAPLAAGTMIAVALTGAATSPLRGARSTPHADECGPPDEGVHSLLAWHKSRQAGHEPEG